MSIDKSLGPNPETFQIERSNPWGASGPPGTKGSWVDGSVRLWPFNGERGIVCVAWRMAWRHQKQTMCRMACVGLRP